MDFEDTQTNTQTTTAVLGLKGLRETQEEMSRMQFVSQVKD